MVTFVSSIWAMFSCLWLAVEKLIRWHRFIIWSCETVTYLLYFTHEFISTLFLVKSLTFIWYCFLKLCRMMSPRFSSCWTWSSAAYVCHGSHPSRWWYIQKSWKQRYPNLWSFLNILCHSSELVFSLFGTMHLHLRRVSQRNSGGSNLSCVPSG